MSSPADAYGTETVAVTDPAPVRELEREWPSLARRSLPARMAEWRLREPALARFASADAVLAFLRDERQRVGEDEVLLALLTRARCDPVAGRVVLQALLPGLKRIAGRVLWDVRERAELWELLLAHGWERICSYPLARRRRRVAANLLLDTLHLTLRDLGRTRTQRSELRELSRTPARSIERDVERPLRNAVAAGAISALEADLILCVRIDRRSIAAASQDFGLSYNATRVRLQRAERRLLLFLGVTPVPRRRTSRPSVAAPTPTANQSPAGELDDAS